MTDEAAAPKPLTLDQHLAHAYDRHVFSKGGWSPQMMAEQMRKDPDLMQAATAKRQSVAAMVAARGERACFVATIQLRALDDALEFAKPA